MIPYSMPEWLQAWCEQRGIDWMALGYYQALEYERQARAEDEYREAFEMAWGWRP